MGHTYQEKRSLTLRPKTIPVGHIYYMNFTAVHPNGTMDDELATAIAKL